MAQGLISTGFNTLVNSSTGQLTTSQNNGGVFVGTAPVISQNPLVTTFTSPGTFTRSPKNLTNTGDLVVCGGGGGGACSGGGGGAGGVIFNPAHPLPASPVPVAVGGGGGGAGNGGYGSGGSGSNFGPISVSGGGGSGRVQPNYIGGGSGQPGGSGGGGGVGSSNPSRNTGFGNGIPGEGNPGGIGTARYGPYDNRSGGGGGGKGQAGGQQGRPLPEASTGGAGIRIPSFPTSTADNGSVGGGSPRGPSVGLPSALGLGGAGEGGYFTPPPGQPGTGGGGGHCYNGGSSGGGGGTGGVYVVEDKIGPASAKGKWTLKGQYTARILNTWPYVTNNNA